MFLIYSVEVPLEPIKSSAVERKVKLIELVCTVKPLLQDETVCPDHCSRRDLGCDHTGT